MTYSTILLTSFIVSLSAAIMPGPMLSMTISQASRRGFFTGPLFVAGHGVLELILVIALMLGLGPILRLNLVFIATAIIGSGFLLWMSLGMMRSLPNLSMRNGNMQRDGTSPFVSGAVLSILNPYWTIWWVSVGLGYITQTLQLGIWAVVVFFCGHILADLTWYSLVSWGVWKGSPFISDRLYRWIIGVCASFLVVFAALFAYNGIARLFSYLK